MSSKSKTNSMNRLFITLAFLCTLISCSNKEKAQNYFGRVNQFEDKNIVSTEFAKRGTFYREFESNGKLEAIQQATIRFELDENITSVKVKNGQRVKKGEILSTLDDFRQQSTLQKSLRTLEKNRLGLEDALINMSYELKDSANIPEHIMKIALIRSGYTDAVSDSKMSRIQLAKTTIVAPFNGIVADVEAKANNKSSQYKQFCTLIDDSAFEITFLLLESEAFELSPGMDVAVIPFVFEKDTITGVLSEINPKVDETGMVQAKAVIINKTKRLAEGMNVKVIVRDKIEDQLIIPKSAITLRQERTVAFVCKNDTAHWRYVEVGFENSSYCTIVGSAIKPGEEVITDGNFNLAHLVPVEKLK